MGKLKKKHTSGVAVKYITRSQAIRKLQISFPDFRRLCIIKGIYPREPNTKRKIKKGSTARHTYYYYKDIQYLLHEPLLQTIREQKIFTRRLTRALAKKDLTAARSLRDNRPVFTYDHVIRERYPTFIDALRDLDDALCLIFLFATFPVNNKINASVISECQRLSAEFQHYVMRARCLRKVFLSIKGIYYQAEIKGQPVTWLVPYQFVQTIPKDVDLQVMLSFLDFYRAFIGFVNYRLFSELGLVYPPKLDISKEAIGAGLDALRIVSKQPDWSQHTDAQTSKKVNLKEIRKSSEQRLKSLQSKMADIVDADMKQEEEQEKEEEEEEDVTMEADTFAEDKVAGEEGDVAKPSALVVHHTSVANLFANQIFFLSREVPRHSLEFVLKACGAQVGWDATQGGASPFTEQDNRITHHVCDRPDPGHAYFGRIYIQPQWVYDSINAGRLLDTTPYRPGATLPAHLSPFVQYEKGDYVPEEAREQFGVQVEESEPASEDEQDQEEQHQMELEAEAAGISFSEYQATQQQTNKERKAKAQRAAEQQLKQDQQKMDTILMSKRQRRLYKRLQHATEQKDAKAQKLRRKKEALKDTK